MLVQCTVVSSQTLVTLHTSHIPPLTVSFILHVSTDSFPLTCFCDPYRCGI
eukprot:m.195313 g.195313  ORF g.195313 m.195313 type:complete len:51 (-) comp14891_c1_seq7:1995-2147(-)